MSIEPRGYTLQQHFDLEDEMEKWRNRSEDSNPSVYGRDDEQVIYGLMGKVFVPYAEYGDDQIYGPAWERSR